jgi:hypothetical protein
MNLNEVKSMFPELEWQRADASKPYPLRCRVGKGVTTITEDQSQGQSLFLVSWVDDTRQCAIRHIVSPAVARFHAELNARMLSLKLERKSIAQGKT